MPSIDIRHFNQMRTPGPPPPKNGNSLVAFLNRDIGLGGNELSDSTKEHLYLELSALLEAGLNLKNAMDLIIDAEEKEKNRNVLKSVSAAIVSGSAFSDALEKTGKYSLYEVYSIRIGEESGKLTEILKELAVYFKHKASQRRKIVSALTYPAVVMTTAFGAVFFMLKFVVPMFRDVFKQFGGELPWITKQVIFFSDLLERYFFWMTALVLLLITVIWKLKGTPTYRKISSGIILKIPVVGNLVKKIYLTRFCNSMRLLINAQLPLLRSLALSRQMLEYYPVESTLAAIENDILSGKSLHQSLKLFEIYPAKMVQLIKVGEETNKLDHFFGVVAEQYMNEIEYRTTSLSSVMEPLIMLFLGVVVGFIMIAMYLPMFELSNNFQ